MKSFWEGFEKQATIYGQALSAGQKMLGAGKAAAGKAVAGVQGAAGQVAARGAAMTARPGASAAVTGAGHFLQGAGTLAKAYPKTTLAAGVGAGAVAAHKMLKKPQQQPSYQSYGPTY